MEDGIVLRGIHIGIPHKKHQATLNLIHEGYLGLNKCKLRAKDTVYWPSLNGQLDKLVLNCELCFKVFSFQMQAETKYISWTGNTSASWDQACH